MSVVMVVLRGQFSSPYDCCISLTHEVSDVDWSRCSVSHVHDISTVITAACDSPGFAVTAEWLQSELGINRSALRKMVIKVPTCHITFNSSVSLMHVACLLSLTAVIFVYTMSHSSVDAFR